MLRFGIDMKTQYRIVRDHYCGFECQKKRWWFPVWMKMGINTHGINTHTTVEKAKEFIESDGSVVAIYSADAGD